MYDKEIGREDEIIYFIMEDYEEYSQNNNPYLHSYHELIKNNVDLITKIIADSNIKIHQITSRVKTSDSLFEKILRNGYYSSIDEIYDICGIRIICIYEKDVEKIAHLLDDKLDVYSVENKESHDGYRALHYIVNNNIDFEDDYLNNMKYEIQIVSILQYAWAEVAHDIIYKNKIPLDYDIQRKFTVLSSSLKSIDDKFNNIIVEHEHTEVPRISSINLCKFFKTDVSLPKIAWAIAYSFKEDLGDVATKVNIEVNPHDCRYFSYLLSYLRINDIKELSNLINDNRQEIIKFSIQIKNSNHEKIGYIPYLDENNILQYNVIKVMHILCDLLCLKTKDKKYIRNYYVYKQSIKDTIFVSNKRDFRNGLKSFCALSRYIL